MEFTHFNDKGRAKMVEVGDKEASKREAVAKGQISMKEEVLELIRDGLVEKGDVLGVAQIAGIMGAKKTSDLIPMCHNIFLSGADIDFKFLDSAIEVEARVKSEGKTGVEMEALTAVSVSLLTIYDMCKVLDKEMEISQIRLVEKRGGKSGDFVRQSRKGRVVSVNISHDKGVVKEAREEGVFLENFGLENDAHGGDWHRQVSLLGLESFDKMENDKVDLYPGIFAENITSQGIELFSLPVGTKLRIGESLQEVTQIGKKCHSGCAIKDQVGMCVMPKEGIFTRVLKGGRVKVGDSIEVIG